MDIEERFKQIQNRLNLFCVAEGARVGHMNFLQESLLRAHDRIDQLVTRVNELQAELEESDLVAFRAFLRTHPQIFSDIERGKEILGIDKKPKS